MSLRSGPGRWTLGRGPGGTAGSPWEGRGAALTGRGEGIRDPGAATRPHSSVSLRPPGGQPTVLETFLPAASWVLLSYLCLFSGGGRGGHARRPELHWRQEP